MTRDEIEKRVKEIIAQIRDIDGLEIGLDWPLQQGTLSLDELDMVELSAEINEALFGITMFNTTTKDDDVFACATVGDVVALVDRSIAATLDARIAEHERIAEAAEAEADRLRGIRASGRRLKGPKR